MRVCIIGKNSKIVQSIAWPVGWCVLSHNDLSAICVADFDCFVVFSWSHTNFDDNLLIYNHLKSSKVIFISTVAVYSLIVRSQWNIYPNWKAHFERIYYDIGASIIRLGPVYINGRVPLIFSPCDLIRSCVLQCVNSDTQMVLTPILRSEDSCFRISYFYSRVLHKISFLINFKYFRMAIEAIVKFSPIKTEFYGYTADAFNVLGGNFLVGFGVLGSRVSFGQRHTVVIDGARNDILFSNGFNGTRIGRSRIGLSHLWHGASIRQAGDGYYKSVPVFIRRKRAPIDSITCGIKSVCLSTNVIEFNTNKIVSPFVNYSKVILAAGPIENSRILLRNIANGNVVLSDHLYAKAGSVETVDLLKHKLVRRIFGIVFGRKIFTNSLDYMVDFSPYVSNEAFDSLSIYNDSKISIIFKLLRNFNLRKINQAIFNKFGFGVATKYMDCTIQFLVKDSVHVSLDTIARHNDFSVFERAISSLSSRFDTFSPSSSVSFFDSQHIVGGSSFLDELSNRFPDFDKNLLILGSPTHFRLDAFHHTTRLFLSRACWKD